MENEYRAKVFKSGNSLALRVPKGLGFKEGAEMTVRESRGSFIVEPAANPKRKIDVSTFAGSAPWLKPLTAEQRQFEERGLDWAGTSLNSDG